VYKNYYTTTKKIRSPLFNYAGIVPVRNLIERLDIASILDANVSVLKSQKPYFESDLFQNCRLGMEH